MICIKGSPRWLLMKPAGNKLLWLGDCNLHYESMSQLMLFNLCNNTKDYRFRVILEIDEYLPQPLCKYCGAVMSLGYIML